ncbi:hypothetical protein KBA73_02365 [Patescibacteria group bacterium]|nr:hypothetical protein [Patescibacteria group bacterium]
MKNLMTLADEDTLALEEFWARGPDYLRRTVVFTMTGEDRAALADGELPTETNRRALLAGLSTIFPAIAGG